MVQVPLKRGSDAFFFLLVTSLGISRHVKIYSARLRNVLRVAQASQRKLRVADDDV